MAGFLAAGDLERSYGNTVIHPRLKALHHYFAFVWLKILTICGLFGHKNHNFLIIKLCFASSFPMISTGYLSGNPNCSNMVGKFFLILRITGPLYLALEGTQVHWNHLHIAIVLGVLEFLGHKKVHCLLFFGKIGCCFKYNQFTAINATWDLFRAGVNLYRNLSAFSGPVYYRRVFGYHTLLGCVEEKLCRI